MWRQNYNANCIKFWSQNSNIFIWYRRCKTQELGKFWCVLIHTSFILMVKARLILLCDFSGFPWYCFDMRSCSLRVQPPTARICRVKYSLSSGAELMVNGCHSCGPKEEKWVIGYSLSEQHILTPINPKYNDWFCQILQGNNYEIVVKIFHISHNLTWYSEIVHI